ncbi:hypothetical protein JK191_13735 [Gluconobacter sphaericus]|uniref:hypothetical protein n=1 Tax=Gluconobacter sphaericus TaxID=574987 RepID=UPI001B8B0EBF|nr:hypothetical protein [Gluconobacter sphaericus]MBS1098582.1 hypothetical protein [Gluconobacter sphaericus]
MFGNDPEQVPSRALTMSAGTILKARHLLLVAVESDKASIINKALNDPISETVSAIAIRLHDKATIILDEAAASLWKRPTIRP